MNMPRDDKIIIVTFFVVGFLAVVAFCTLFNKALDSWDQTTDVVIELIEQPPVE